MAPLRIPRGKVADLKAAHFIKVAPLLDLEIFQDGLNRFARASAMCSQCNGLSFFVIIV